MTVQKKTLGYGFHFQFLGVNQDHVAVAPFADLEGCFREAD